MVRCLQLRTQRLRKRVQKVFRLLPVYALVLGFFAPVVSFAPPQKWEPTWGAELTFTSDAQEQSKDYGPNGDKPWSTENQEAMEKFLAVAKKELKGRSDVVSIQHLSDADKWGNDVVRVKYADGFSFDVTMDPFCLEVIPQYGTLGHFKKNKNRIQKDIFGLMKKIGLEPRRDTGGGHLHMGAQSAFGDNVLLFRDWLVDKANHSELSTGAMEKDYSNSFPLVKLTKSQRLRFEEWVKEVDVGRYRAVDIDPVRKAASDFIAEVLFEKKVPTGKEILKYKDLEVELLRMGKVDFSKVSPNNTWAEYAAWVQYDPDNVPKGARTAEIRHLIAPENADHLIDNITLLQGRLQYLKNKNEPIQLSQEFLSGKIPSAKDGAQRFYLYLLESGVEPRKFMHHLPIKSDGIKDWKAWREEFEKAAENQLKQVIKGGCALHKVGK